MEYLGGCFCGAVRYKARQIFDAGYCHCSICRRISGAAAVCWFSVREEDFELTLGDPSALRSSEHFTRYFCRACGTHVHGMDDLPVPPSVGSRLVSAMLGTLDDPSAVMPALHQWWSSRVPWYEEALALPRFDTGLIPHPAKRPRRTDRW
ncbi:GFA family protein [Methylibium rhizosphaerae]|uniref:GFA family protein n=1 Tax=Methylibium rhizosphaerae TaxID=2570323 RepID=UPI001125E260